MRRPGRTQVDWETPEKKWTWEHVGIEVMMDIRSELRRLNNLLHCQNFQNMPHTLKRIDKRLARHAPLSPGRKAHGK